MATSKTLTSLADRYAVGATVGAYPESNWQTNEPFSGVPKGSSTTTGTIGSDGSVALTGLADSTRYVLVNSSGTRVYTHFDTFDPTTNGATPAGRATSVDPSVVEIGDIQAAARASLEFNTFNVKDAAYGAVGDVRRLSDVSTTNSSTTVTSATGAFTSADIGKSIVIHNGAGGGVALKTTISSVTNSTTIVVANAAGTTTTNLTAVFGTDDTAAIQAAITAAGAVSGTFWNANNRSARFVDVVIPRGIYYVNNLTVSSPWIRFIGMGGGALVKNANGPMFTITGQGTEFHRCVLDGNANGNTPDYTGNGITCSTGHDDFKFLDGRISNVDPDAYAIQYTSVSGVGGGTACTRKEISRSSISKYGAPTASYAIGYPGTASLAESAGSSKIIDCEAEGGSLVDTSGCSSLTLMGNVSSAVGFSSTSSNVRLIGNRIFGNMTLEGEQHVVAGNTFGAVLTLGTSVNLLRMGHNAHASAYVDNSTAANNRVLDTRDRSDLNGAVGDTAPSTRGWVGVNNTSVSAATTYGSRFVPKRDMSVTRITFAVTNAGGSGDTVQAAIYSADGQTKLGSSSAVSPIVSATGVKYLDLTATVGLKAGVVYYIALSFSAGVQQILGAGFGSGFGVILNGTTTAANNAINGQLGTWEGVSVAGGTSPATLTGASFSGTLPVLSVRES